MDANDMLARLPIHTTKNVEWMGHPESRSIAELLLCGFDGFG
jgi:hypothetical protein